MRPVASSWIFINISLEPFFNLFIIICASHWDFQGVLYIELLDWVPKKSKHALVM